MRTALALLLLAALAGPPPARAQLATSRNWQPDERTLVTDLSGVTAVAATQDVVYAATRDALAVYDRYSFALRDVVGTLDGYPGGLITTMVADPADNTAWIAGFNGWADFQPLGRRVDGGTLPGAADRVVLDAGNPSRGAWYHTPAGWYFVPEMGIMAQPARDAPPPGRWIAQLGPQDILARAPGFELVRLTITRDAQLRTFRISGAAAAPASNDLFVATDGNGLWKVDATTYATQRFPSGLLAAPTGAVATNGEDVCAGTDARFRAVRRGVTCFTGALDRFDYYEGSPVSGVSGTIVRRLLITRTAIWAATDQGALRIDRRTGDVRTFDTHNGLPSFDVRALAPSGGAVWIGTSRGLALVPDSATALHAILSIDLSAPVLALATEADTLWLGTDQGPYELPPGATAPVAAAAGVPSLAVPVVALAVRGDTVLAATESRLLWRAGGQWHDAAPPSPPIGQLTALAADRAGFWVGGTLGVAFCQPARGLWRALPAPGAGPPPVCDGAAGRDWLWAATPLGVVRLRRDVLAP